MEVKNEKKDVSHSFILISAKEIKSNQSINSAWKEEQRDPSVAEWVQSPKKVFCTGLPSLGTSRATLAFVYLCLGVFHLLKVSL